MQWVDIQLNKFQVVTLLPETDCLKEVKVILSPTYQKYYIVPEQMEKQKQTSSTYLKY